MVVAKPLDGGVPSELTKLEQPSSVAGLLADGTYVYVAESRRGTISRYPTGGGPGEVLIAGQSWLGDFIADATHLYWTSGSFNDMRDIYQLEKRGGSPKLLASELRPSNLTESGDHLYYRDGREPEINRLPKIGGEPVRMPTSNWTFGLAVRGSFLYYGSSGAIRRMSINGGSETQLFTIDSTDFSMDETHAYWVGDMQIVGARVEQGSQPSRVAGFDREFKGFALNGNFLYIASFNQIVRVPKAMN